MSVFFFFQGRRYHTAPFTSLLVLLFGCIFACCSMSPSFFFFFLFPCFVPDGVVCDEPSCVGRAQRSIHTFTHTHHTHTQNLDVALVCRFSSFARMCSTYKHTCRLFPSFLFSSSSVVKWSRNVTREESKPSSYVSSNGTSAEQAHSRLRFLAPRVADGAGALKAQLPSL